MSGQTREQDISPPSLERFPAKRVSVRVKKTRQIKK
jgi:hypothetical protein